MPRVLRGGAALLLGGLAFASGTAAPRAAAQKPQAPAEFRWGGDPEGGYPYVEADPSDPSRVVGFDVEIANLIEGSASAIGDR